MDHSKTLTELLDIVIKESGSDLHVAEGRQPVIRVSGILTPITRIPALSKQQMLEIVDTLLTKSNKEIFLASKEIDFSYDFGENGRFRGNAFFQQGKISVVLRLIPKKIRLFKELNLPPILEQFAKKEQGFFLVVGPVGQGKTTTLAAIIETINQERAEHILTIEDPIEYIYEPKKSIIDQREIRIDTTDFPTAMRSMFREDINVVLIGEMRGPETIATAVTAAETGHYVLSTLHTNTASQTIDRIIDSFPASQQGQIRSQLAGSLTGIFSQRLVPMISGGLIPVYELLINNAAVANLIREGRIHEINSVIETGMAEGMIDMNRSLIEMVRDGKITFDTAMRYSPNPKILEKMM
ncbi:MAG: PilT/PilU family type 4a pilus ATPase [Patescibacteria group bacterium]